MSDWNAGFPVIVYQEGMTLPETGTYFVVSGNGLWLHKEESICTGFVPVNNISCLPDLNAETFVNVKLPKIPAVFVWKIKEFFRKVVAEYRSESEVSLYFNKELGIYKIYVPKQEVSHASVKYQRIGTTHLPEFDGFLEVGTIHSHCDFGAFHSGVDVGDEHNFDGLHITFGHNDKDTFSISASLVVNGFRTKVKPVTVLEGISRESAQPVDKDEFFSLEPISDELKEVYREEVNVWFTQVKPLTFRNSFRFDPVAFLSNIPHDGPTIVLDSLTNVVTDSLVKESPTVSNVVTDPNVAVETFIQDKRVVKNEENPQN